MTAPRSVTRAALARAATILILTGALAGCAGSATAERAPTPSASTAGPCAKVSVVVNFGTLGAKTIHACAGGAVAADVLKAAKIATAGTSDYGDQVVCRVDDLPSPATESCAKLPSAAYWALWIKTSTDAKWEYAQAGVTTQTVTNGESLGLVYTQGSDETPPQD